MSSCIKDLYYYDLVKKCSKCAIISLKSNFHKDITKTMDIDLLVNGVQINIIKIIKIEYLTIIKLILKTIDVK